MGLVKAKNLSTMLREITPDTDLCQFANNRSSAHSEANIDSSQSVHLWISQLSSASAAQTAIELYRSLPQIINLDIDPQSKLSTLEILYPEIIQCTEQLLSNQLTQDTAKAVSLGQALIRYAYEGYKSLAYQFSLRLNSLERTNSLEQTNSLEPVNSPELLTDTEQTIGRCLFRSFQLLGQIQFNSLSHYLARPSNFWRDLHTLYSVACTMGIEQDNLSKRVDPRSSIHTVYIKLLLINCTRPNHFSNYELKFFFNELDFWSSLAELETGSTGGLFVIDTASNLGPVYADNATASSDNLVLDTFNLVKFLNSSLTERANHNVFSDRISRRVVKDLVRQWGEKILRQETHIKDKAKVNIACGITSTLCMLAKTNSFENFLKLCGQSAIAQPAVSYSQTSNDIWHSGAANISPQRTPPSDPISYAEIQRRQAKLKLVTGLRINTSLNGACIELVEEQPEMLPGKPIALGAKGTQRWAAGIVRWKQITPSLSTLCDIQFPAKYCIPAAIRGFRRSQNSDRQFMQAIIFTRQKDLSEQTSLICPPLRYTKGPKFNYSRPTTSTPQLCLKNWKPPSISLTSK
ncbi:MAG: hypothetical protein P8M77_07910 [Porticoccaceae bacterium]|nr:hypothetical protein [Porticoccaceae bacterium]